MTQEEKNKYYNELSSKYLNRLNSVDVPTEMSDLLIQDLLVLKSRAMWALEKEIFVFDENSKRTFNERISEMKSLAISKVKTLEKLFVLYDNVTKLPFIDDYDRINIFSTKEYADEALDYYLQQYRNWRVEEISKDGINAFLQTVFFLYGAQAVVVDNGQQYDTFFASEMVEQPSSATFSNPEYMLALIKFQQEYHWRMNYERKMEKLRSFETAMINGFCKSTFLLPVKDGEIQMLEKESALRFYSAFTDKVEMEKVYKRSDGYETFEISARKLADAPVDCVINVGSIAFQMRREMVKQMFAIYEKGK